ncbi:hypothetical protein OCHUTO_0711 [Orientia chuto str. Dubai]|uniref:Uncharacterized protein n=1 Tax=Orientia chuto str. Dubai TaxID=1359168 RepID=A0A0F3MJ76_9RICK|nr:hypothetical protein OCHUTO_0711 [Orientia chuto str. Dubai]
MQLYCNISLIGSSTYTLLQIAIEASRSIFELSFCCKTLVLNYITKALANELRSIDQANSNNLRFNDVKNFKEKYLTQIEIDPSKESPLKRKIAGTFESDMAYKILASCSFGPAVRTRFFVKLLKNITLTECDKPKILEAVQNVYGFNNCKLHHLRNLKLFHGNKSVKKSIC